MPRNRQPVGFRGRLSKALTGRQPGNAPIVLPSFTAASLLLLAPHATQALWVESGSQSVPETHARLNGDLVGQVDDLSPCCNEFLATTAGRPVLATGPTGGACFTFASGKHLITNNSIKSFNSIHTTLTGTIAIRFRPTTDGVFGGLLDSCNWSAGSNACGFLLRRDSDNKITFGIAAGDVSWRYLKTSTGTILAAGGERTLIITMNGTIATIYFDGVQDSTVAVGGAVIPAKTAHSCDLRIGQQHDGTDSFVGDIGQVVISPTAWDAATRAAFIAWNPAKTNAPLLRKIADEGDPYDYTGWTTIYDGKVIGSLFQDRIAVPVTPVVSASDPIGTWVNQVANTNRNAVAASDAARPTYQTGGGALYDGSDDNLSFANWPAAGNFHLFLVVSNSDATRGSHVVAVQGGTGYIALTGAGWADPASTCVPHLDASYAVAVPLTSSAGLNLIEVVRTPQGLFCRLNGTGAYSAAADPETGVGCAYNRMGTPAVVDWNMHGSLDALWRNQNDMRGPAADAVAASIKGQWGL